MATVVGSPKAGVHVTIDAAALRHLLTAPDGDVGRHMVVVLNDVRNRAVGYAPVITGRLRSSIQVDGPTPKGDHDMEGEVGSNVEYAYWVHQGRGPVRPVSKRVLRWVTRSGEVVFRPYAGPAAGQPFLQRALDDVL